jgi:hypothetical protein
MRYADSLLTEGEQIVLRSRQHWLALLSRARTGVLLWVIGLALLVVVVWFNVAPGVVRNVISGVAMVFLALGLVIFIFRGWQWWAQDYIVTNRRLLKVTGIMNKRSADSSLEKINDAILSQSLWGRILNFGNLEILTAADQAVDRYYMLKSPKEFKKVMLTQKHNLETEFIYGRQPSPPLRAESQAEARPAPPPTFQAPPAPPLPPQPMAASPQPMSETVDEDESLEVTQTLARLADLRDQGAITAEEYEQKKDELLGRL